MSNWTHVAGVVRLDSFRGTEGNLIEEMKDTDYTLEDFHNVFGKECLFEDSMSVWRDADEHPKDYLPMGSEGSLQLSIWTNHRITDMFSYVVSIFGDLRDHDDPQEIIDWFKYKLEEINEDDFNNLYIRQATITVDNEANGVLNWTAE